MFYNNHQQKFYQEPVYKSPYAAALWSLCLPGFGQLYVREYFIGIILLASEIAFNILSKLNWSIYYSFTGKLQESSEIVNMGWGLFYPSVYAFNIWHAYNTAKFMNAKLKAEGVPRPDKLAHNMGFFTGLVFGMFFGLHWAFLISPVFSGIVLGISLAIIGHLIEKCVDR
ncbi:hypothetical protein [Paenibacillus sp. WC2504]|uniref:hypothetical protein n=1 Tax=Paenibacillus sp. WC2504 TaxID=3461403 RepID=UPI004045B132